MIDYLDETLCSIDNETKETLSRKRRPFEGKQDSIQLKERDHIAYEMDTINDVVDWLETGNKEIISRYREPQKMIIEFDKIQMEQIDQPEGENWNQYP